MKAHILYLVLLSSFFYLAIAQETNEATESEVTSESVFEIDPSNEAIDESPLELQDNDLNENDKQKDTVTSESVFEIDPSNEATDDSPLELQDNTLIEDVKQKEDDSKASSDVDSSNSKEILVEESEVSNSTEKNNTTNTPSKKIVCKALNRTIVNSDGELEFVENQIQMFNTTGFLNYFYTNSDSNVTNRSTPGLCVIGFFFAPWCPFSAQAAPNFNILPKYFPDIEFLGLDSADQTIINTHYGIVGLPTIILFHNSRGVGKFNYSDYTLENYQTFVENLTGLKPKTDVNITKMDYEGPIPTVATIEPDYVLYLAWSFTIICSLYYFGKSNFCQRIFESIRNTWREAEMHEHQD